MDVDKKVGKTQLTSNLLMIRPTNFGFNPETADNNAFQVADTSLSAAEIKSAAIKEFDVMVDKLRAVGISVFVHQERENAISTDSVFPNNWFSCHRDGLLVTYPMFSPIRRTERHPAVIEELEQDFLIKTHIKLDNWEKKDQFLEGTGSMILDRENSIAYACRSVRTNEALLDQFCYFMCYEKQVFDATDDTGMPVYHTNVMMALGDTFVVICLDTINDRTQREDLIATFERTGKEIISISVEQMKEFAGNMLQVKNKAGQSFLVMSSRAYHSLTPTQLHKIEQLTTPLHSDLTVIETYGGGSARCMIAEIFFPEKV